MYYRITQDLKIEFVKYFQTIFTLYKEGKLAFADGRNKIIFSKTPVVLESDNYYLKDFPCLLIGISPGSVKDISVNKYKGLDKSIPAPEYIYGFTANVTVTFTVYALTKQEKCMLSDLVSFLLAKHDTKQTFLGKGVCLKMPSFTGDGVEEEGQTNTKRFYATITLEMESEVEYNNIILDLNGNSGLTVIDVISYVADTSNM